MIFHGQIRIAPEVAPAERARVLLVINDDYRYPAETIDGMWGTKEGGVYVVTPWADYTEEDGFVGAPRYQPEQLGFEYWHAEFAYYPSQVWLGAFVDLDDSGGLDPGEP